MGSLICLIAMFAAANAGLLRVPKVYNAVITSNQNLSPSRAFPVIQPIIHRTSIGYVPPLYYTQVAPHFTAQSYASVVQKSRSSARDKELPGSLSSSALETEESSRALTESKEEEKLTEKTADKSMNPPGEMRKKSKEQEQLSFYPNYQSLYYDPYIYTYNGYNTHIIPGTYYVDYQPFRALDPIPATRPKNAEPTQFLPSYPEDHREKTETATMRGARAAIAPSLVPSASPIR